jgi:hypothetical protein
MLLCNARLLALLMMVGKRKRIFWYCTNWKILQLAINKAAKTYVYIQLNLAELKASGCLLISRLNEYGIQ